MIHNNVREFFKINAAINKIKFVFSSEYGIGFNHALILQELSESPNIKERLEKMYPISVSEIIHSLESDSLIKEIKMKNAKTANARYFTVTAKGKKLLEQINNSDLIPEMTIEGE